MPSPIVAYLALQNGGSPAFIRLQEATIIHAEDRRIAGKILIEEPPPHPARDQCQFFRTFLSLR